MGLGLGLRLGLGLGLGVACRVEEGAGGQHDSGGLDLEDLAADVVLAPATRGCRLVSRQVQADCRLVAALCARGCTCRTCLLTYRLATHRTQALTLALPLSRCGVHGVATHLIPVTVCPSLPPYTKPTIST